MLKGDAIQNSFKQISDLQGKNEAISSPVLEKKPLKSPKKGQQKIMTPEPRVQHSLLVSPVLKTINNPPISPKPRVIQNKKDQPYQKPNPPFQTLI